MNGSQNDGAWIDTRRAQPPVLDLVRVKSADGTVSEAFFNGVAWFTRGRAWRTAPFYWQPVADQAGEGDAVMVLTSPPAEQAPAAPVRLCRGPVGVTPKATIRHLHPTAASAAASDEDMSCADTPEAAADDVGCRAMAALSQAVTADKADAAAQATPPEAQAPEQDDADAWMDSRICRLDSYSSRVLACIQPGGRLHDAVALVQAQDRRGRQALSVAENLQDLADAVLADKFAATYSPRRKR